MYAQLVDTGLKKLQDAAELSGRYPRFAAPET